MNISTYNLNLLGDYHTNRDNLFSWGLFLVFSAWFFLSVNPVGMPFLSGVNGYDFKRIVQVVLLCFSSVIYLRLNLWNRLLNTPDTQIYGVLIGSIFILIFWGVPFSGYVHQSLFESLHWALLFSVFLSGFFLQRTGRANQLILVLLFFHSCLVLKGVIFLFLDLYIAQSVRPSIFYPSVTSLRFFNQIQVFFIPCLAVFVLHPRWGKIAILLLFSNLLLAVLGGARGLLISLLCTGCVAYFLVKNVKRQLICSALVLLSVCVTYWIITCVLNIAATQEMDSPLRMHSSGRLSMWNELISSLSFKHFFYGSGAGAYAFTDFVRFEGHPHNSVLQFIFEWGVLTTGCIIFLVVSVLYKAFIFVRVMNADESQFVTGAFLALISACVYSIFSGIFVMPIPQTLSILFLGFLGGSVSLTDINSEKKPSLMFLLLCSSVVFSILLIYLTICAYYFKQQSSDLNDYRGPRYWLNGAPIVSPN
jgi:O-antigen ligase